MSLLNKASLIQIPSGYKDGTLYSAKPTNGDGDFTFSRGSNLAATRVNSDGLIEKGRENLLLQSNQFDTTWSKSSGITLTSGQAGYDGSNDAWLVERSAAYNNLYQSNSSFFTPISTISVYAKAGTYNFLRFAVAGVGEQVYFNLTDGSVGVNTELIASSAESVGNGWWRLSATFQDSSASGIYIQPVETDGGIGNAGTGSIYIQDAQLEAGLVATDYIETGASTAQAGILEDMPRLDYSGGATCPSLLLESQRTNLLTNSEYLDGSGWNKSSGGTGSTPITTINTNETLSPEGVYNATKIIFDSGSGTTTGDLSLIEGVVAIAAGTDACTSIWLKGENGGEQLHMRGVSNGSFSIITLTTEWQQFITSENSSTTTDSLQFGIRQNVSGLGIINSNATIYAYGAQIEEGSYPTSYIPTYGSSVTRSADFGSNSTDTLGGLSEGTFFIEMSRNGIDTNETGSGISLRDNSGVEEIRLHFDAPTSQVRWRDGNNSFATIGNPLSITAETTFKILVKTDGTTAKVFGNGTQLGSDYSIVSAFDLQRIYNNGLGYQLKQQLFFPTALTDSECEQLTTI